MHFEMDRLMVELFEERKDVCMYRWTNIDGRIDLMNGWIYRYICRINVPDTFTQSFTVNLCIFTS